MNDKILEAIEQSLPQMQVTAIRKALNELDELREKNKALEADKKTYVGSYREQRERANDLERRLTTKVELLATTAQSLAEYQTKDVEARVALAEGKLEAVNTTVDKFLKNTIYRESLQHEVIEEYRGSNSQYVNGQQVSTPYVNKAARPVTDVKTKETE